MPETRYDAAILQQYADDLYAQARWAIYSTAFIYGLVTFGVAFVISNVGTIFKSNVNLSLQPGVLLIALIGVAVGVAASFGVTRLMASQRSSSSWKRRLFSASARLNSTRAALRSRKPCQRRQEDR